MLPSPLRLLSLLLGLLRGLLGAGLLLWGLLCLRGARGVLLALWRVLLALGLHLLALVLLALLLPGLSILLWLLLSLWLLVLTPRLLHLPSPSLPGSELPAFLRRGSLFLLALASELARLLSVHGCLLPVEAAAGERYVRAIR